MKHPTYEPHCGSRRATFQATLPWCGANGPRSLRIKSDRENGPLSFLYVRLAEGALVSGDTTSRGLPSSASVRARTCIARNGSTRSGSGLSSYTRPVFLEIMSTRRSSRVSMIWFQAASKELPIISARSSIRLGLRHREPLGHYPPSLERYYTTWVLHDVWPLDLEVDGQPSLLPIPRLQGQIEPP